MVPQVNEIDVTSKVRARMFRWNSAKLDLCDVAFLAGEGDRGYRSGAITI